MNGMKILSMVMLILAISQIGYAIYSFVDYYETKDDIKTVDCYDGFKNKIYDTTCEQVGDDEALRIAAITFFIGCFMLIIIQSMWYMGDSIF